MTPFQGYSPTWAGLHGAEPHVRGYRPFWANLPPDPDDPGLSPGLMDDALSGLYSLPDLRFTGLTHALGDIAPSGLISRRIRITPGSAQG